MGILSLFRRSQQSASTRWDEFFEAAQIHETLRDSLRNFVGSWPSGLDPAAFGGDAGRELARKLHAFITGPYPADSLNEFSPEYRAAEGKIARGSNQFVDMMLCTVIPKRELSNQEPHIAVWRLVEKYSSLPLARLVFTLPQILMLSWAKRGERVVWVVKDGEAESYRHLSTDQILKIQVYKGVENALFGAYDDLPEGGYLSDQAIDKRIRSLLS